MHLLEKTWKIIINQRSIHHSHLPLSNLFLKNKKSGNKIPAWHHQVPRPPYIGPEFLLDVLHTDHALQGERRGAMDLLEHLGWRDSCEDTWLVNLPLETTGNKALFRGLNNPWLPLRRSYWTWNFWAGVLLGTGRLTRHEGWKVFQTIITYQMGPYEL